MSLRVPPKPSRRAFTRRKEVASVSLFQTTVARLRKPQQSARAFGPPFVDGEPWLEIQVVSMHSQNTQDSAGFAQIATDNPLKIGNSATSPVLYRFRGKQVHPDEQLHGSDESSFLKEILSRFDNSRVVPILPIICRCDFFQGNVPTKCASLPRRADYPDESPTSQATLLWGTSRTLAKRSLNPEVAAAPDAHAPLQVADVQGFPDSP